MHGSILTPQMALKHAYFWLRYLATIVAPEVTNVAFSVGLPLDVDKDYVRNDLTLKLGEPLRTSTFDSDEAIYVKYPISRTMNP